MTYTDFDLDRIGAMTGASKGQAIKELLDAERDRLKIEAQKLSGDENSEAFKRIPSQVKNYRKDLLIAIKDRLDEKGTDIGELGKLEDVIDMNILHDGSLVSAATLARTNLTGKIDIQNPNEDIVNNKAFKDALNTGGILSENLKKIQDILVRSTRKIESSDLKSKIDLPKFLGAVDTSKAETREEVYDYWKTIAEKFTEVNATASKFIEAIKSSDLEEDLKNKFVDLFDMRNFGRLQYIVDFPSVEDNLLKPRHRFFNLISAMIATERLLENKSLSPYEQESEESSYGDVNAKLMEDMLQGIQGSDMGATTVNQWTGTAEINDPKIESSIINDGPQWVDSVDSLMSAADPLLMYEVKINDKLVAVTKEAYVDFQELIESAVEKIEDGSFKVTLDFKTDLERWSDELEDTMVLDQKDGFYLPISVLSNNVFDSLYTQNEFDGTVIDEPLDLGTMEDIQDFFDGLYELIVEDIVTMATDVRTTRGQGRGTDMKLTFRGKDINTNELAGSASRQFDKPLPESAEFSSALTDDIKGALEAFMEQCLEYYFTPAYTGRMPIQTPDFVGSVGGRVMQILSANLGLETVMSGAYQRMTKLTKPFKEKDLENIADFLQNVFLKSLTIDSYLIADAERAARSLSNIFGQNTLEANNNYFAALLYHFMEKTNKTELMDDDFNKKPINERRKLFDEGYKNRKAYPIFAMPFWLDMNQGLITQKSKKAADQYKRLKNIFESVQRDLSQLIHKMLDAHDAVRGQLGKPVVYGFFPMNALGYETIINKMHLEEHIDLTNYEVENVIKAIDSHESIAKEYGISSEQVYSIKAHFR